MKKGFAGSLIVLLLVFVFTGCQNNVTDTDQPEQEIKVIKEKGPNDGDPVVTGSVKTTDTTGSGSSDVSVWYPYWDYDTADRELELIGDDLNTICFFAAYYDVNGEPFIPEDTQETFKNLDKSGRLDNKHTYLTFVNDKLLEQGSSLKDTDLLYDLLGDRALADSHADDIIKLTKKLGCEGIEIDYEAIKKDKKLWQHFYEFVNVLCQKAQNESIPVRVVFEPSAPVTEYEWPQYAEYVMMCYNLNGYGTKAGPKADIAWIKELCEKMKTLKGQPNMAFAGGGFDFSDDGTVAQIDYCLAEQIRIDSHADVQRDENSKVLYFSYLDENSTSHQIWYADQETLKSWTQTARDCGIDRVSIWRLGGNINE